MVNKNLINNYIGVSFFTLNVPGINKVYFTSEKSDMKYYSTNRKPSHTQKFINIYTQLKYFLEKKYIK